MGLIVGYLNGSPMGLNNGFAKIQSKSQTAPVVGNLIAASVELIKNFAFLFVRDAFSGVRDLNLSHVFGSLR